MAEKQYAICEDGYIRCANCEAIKGDEHDPACDGGSVLVAMQEKPPVRSDSFPQGE